MMAVAPSARESAEERSSLFVWILLGSVAVHAGSMVVLPKRHAARALEVRTAIEIAEPPEAPPPPPKAEEAPAATAPVTPIASKAVAAVRTTSAPAAAPPSEPISNDAPLDFTGSGSGADGLVRGTSGAAPTPAPIATVTATAKPAAPPFVPASALARPPGAPGLDAELERNYPVEARRAGIAGKAVLRLEVRFDGSIGKVVHVSESGTGFAEACERTVRAARWEPPLDREGHRVSTEITYVCRFEVRG